MSAPETFLGGRVTLHAGDCLDVLRTLPDASMDSIVSDPPYALVSITRRFGKEGSAPSKVPEGGSGAYARASSGFMGQKWDTGERAFSVEFWAECFRVLKPGGHVVAFAASRTSHRLTCAIEDAGFEIRDTIYDFIASDTHAAGFLASLSEAQILAFARVVEESGFGGLLGWCFGTGFPKSHDVAKGIDRAAGAEREIIGRKRNNKGDGGTQTYAALGAFAQTAFSDITAPATDAARQWEGWGTALKPALEPITLARKPLAGTVAENVLAHGTGALSIDACRIEAPEGVAIFENGGAAAINTFGDGLGGGVYTGERSFRGRWPANVIHDGSDEVVAAFPAQAGGGDLRGAGSGRRPGGFGGVGGASGSAEPCSVLYADQGSAARFFYSAKADGDSRIGSAHPTVKPVDLMRWLVRLVTPPGGVVLDPFAGTGTTGEAAFREGMRAVLVEREPAYRVDIARRMALAEAGPAIRRAESAKARARKAAPLALFGEEGA